MQNIQRMGPLLMVFFFVALAGFGYVHLRQGGPKVPETMSGSGLRRNLYVLTTAGLRADHLTMYLFQHGQTPGIDSLGFDGVQFLHAYSNAPGIDAGLEILLSGRNAGAGGMSQTIPEYLEKRGYRTAAFTQKSPAKITGFKAPPAEFERLDEITSNALLWIGQNRHASHAAFLIYPEPVPPYEPRPPYDQHYRNHPYDGEIAYIDDQVAKFVHTLKAENLYRNSIVLFVSLFAGKADDSEHLDMRSTPIPMMIAAPGLLPRMTTYEHAVSPADVFPTIRALMEDPPAPNEFDGVVLFQKGSTEEIERDFPF